MMLLLFSIFAIFKIHFCHVIFHCNDLYYIFIKIFYEVLYFYFVNCAFFTCFFLFFCAVFVVFVLNTKHIDVNILMYNSIFLNVIFLFNIIFSYDLYYILIFLIFIFLSELNSVDKCGLFLTFTICRCSYANVETWSESERGWC